MMLRALSPWAVYPRSAGVTAPVCIQANYSATPLTGYFPLTVTFEDKSSGVITNYAWDFLGDGGVPDSTSASPTYIYVSAGVYSPQLTVYNTSSGVINVCAISNYVVVCAPPTAPQGTFTASPQSGTTPLTVTFDASVSGPLAQIYWDFDGDGSYETFGSTAQYIYTSAGTYNPRMVLTGLEGYDTVVSNTTIEVSSSPLTPSTSAVTWQSWRTRLS
jgi:PKD repeat protein